MLQTPPLHIHLPFSPFPQAAGKGVALEVLDESPGGCKQGPPQESRPLIRRRREDDATGSHHHHSTFPR